MGLNFNYEFDFSGKNQQILQAKINEKKAVEAELAEAQLVISTSVAQIYFQLTYETMQLQLAQQKLKINTQLLSIIQGGLKRGIESEIPVQTIQSTLQETQQKVEYAKQMVILSQNRLAILLGKNPFTTHIKIKFPAVYDY